jgi:hypothetical protein
MCRVFGHESQEIEQRNLIGAGSNKSETFGMEKSQPLDTPTVAHKFKLDPKQ